MEPSFFTAPETAACGIDQEIDSLELFPGYGSGGAFAGDYLSTFDFGATAAAALAAAAQSPLVQPTLDSDWSDDLILNSDQDRGVEHAVMATNEHCSNGQADSGISGIHCRNTRSGGAEAVNSSQQVSSHSFNHRKNEPDRFRKQDRGVEHAVMATNEHCSNGQADSRISGIHCRNTRSGGAEAVNSSQQEHSSINHKLSWGACCSTLPKVIGNEDEKQSTSDAFKPDLGEPKMGMTFPSEEEVHRFYSNYAKKAGFKVRRGKPRYLRSDKSIITGKTFVCNYQGRKSTEQIDKETLFKRPDFRNDCKAMIRCTVNDQTWKISTVVLEHSHDLTGCLTSDEGRAEDSHATASLLTGKFADEVTTAEEWPFNSNVKHSDVSQGTWKSRPMPEFNDTRDLIDYFENMQMIDPFFFYTMQVEAAQGMANFFWRDSRSKDDYVHFGDVLILDTRTRITKDMICPAFLGLNHHRQCIIFGCAVLVNQTVGSFKWLLQSFLKAMGWQKPQTIITDVSDEIANALTDLLPETETRHCLTAWSILNNFSKHLPPLNEQVDRSGLDDLFGECVFHVQSEEEFESKWNSLKSKLHEDTWLASLYRMRKKWSLVYTKDVFSAGLLSIKHNENARAVFGNLSYETKKLSQIAHQCRVAAERMRMEELMEDWRCEKDMENLKSRSPMEKEAERLYTRQIFKMFQGELINSLSLAIEKSLDTATPCKFKLTEEGSTKIDTVEFDPSNLTLACSCKKFESVGILCFHALKVLNSKNIFKIPSHYLLKRWTKSAKDNLPVDVPNAEITRDRNQVNSLYVEFMQKALHVAHKCTTKERKRIALDYMDRTLENIAKVPRLEESTVAFKDSDGNVDML